MSTYDKDPSLRPGSLENLIGRYEGGLQDIASQHDLAMYPIAANYIASIHQGEGWESTLSVPGQTVNTVTEHTFGNLGRFLNEAHAAMIYGIQQDPSSLNIWAAICREVDTFGIDCYTVEGLIEGVGSSSMRSVMRAALDKYIWQKIQTSAATYGPDGYLLDKYFDLASSVGAAKAMRAALDKNIWQKIQSTAATYGPDSDVLASMFESTSHIKVEKLFRAMLAAKYASSGRSARERDHIRGDYSADGILRDIFRRTQANSRPHQNVFNRGQHSQQQQTPPPPPPPQQPTPKPTPERAPRDERIDKLKGNNISAPDKPFVTLLANVDHHRKNGKTDLQIYRLLFRHFHPDQRHPDSEVMSPVIEGSYDKIKKQFRF